MTELGHDLLGAVQRVIQLEGHQIGMTHEIFDRNTLVDHAGSRIGVQIGCNDGALTLLCHADDLRRDLGIQTDNQTGSSMLNGFALDVLPVCNDDDIIFFHAGFYDIQICGSDHNFSINDPGMRVTADQGTLQYLDQVAEWCPGKSQDMIIQHFHIGTGDIIDRDQTLQLISALCDRQCDNIQLPHEQPGIPDGNRIRDTLRLAEINIPHLDIYILQIFWCIHMEIVQDKCSFIINITGTAWYIMAGMFDIL